MPSNAGFYSSNVEQTPRETKEYTTQKFVMILSKVMILCAVSNNGVSRVHVAEKTIEERYQSILKSHLVY